MRPTAHVPRPTCPLARGVPRALLESAAVAEPQPAHELVDRFLGHLAVERGASPNTVRAYSADLARYLEWADRSGIDPITLTHRQMRLYLAELDRAGYARRTVARRLSAVRSFFAYLVAEGLAPSDPSSVLAAPRSRRDCPRSCPADVVEAHARGTRSGDTVGIRDRAVLELLYATGARVSEISELAARATRSRSRPDHGDGQGLQGAHRPAASQGRRDAQGLPRYRAPAAGETGPATITSSCRPEAAALVGRDSSAVQGALARGRCGALALTACDAPHLRDTPARSRR